MPSTVVFPGQSLRKYSYHEAKVWNCYDPTQIPAKCTRCSPLKYLASSDRWCPSDCLADRKVSNFPMFSIFLLKWLNFDCTRGNIGSPIDHDELMIFFMLKWWVQREQNILLVAFVHNFIFERIETRQKHVRSEKAARKLLVRWHTIWLRPVYS